LFVYKITVSYKIDHNSFEEQAERTHRKDVGIKRVEISKDVNSGIVKRLHAAVMITSGINVVDANGVGSKLGHEAGITFALGSIKERVLGDKLVRNA
jgi:hypothetical protein